MIPKLTRILVLFLALLSIAPCVNATEPPFTASLNGTSINVTMTKNPILEAYFPGASYAVTLTLPYGYTLLPAGSNTPCSTCKFTITNGGTVTLTLVPASSHTPSNFTFTASANGPYGNQLFSTNIRVSNEVYVSTQAGQINKFNAFDLSFDGSLSTSFSSPLAGIAADPINNFLFVANQGNNTIAKLNINGTPVNNNFISTTIDSTTYTPVGVAYNPINQYLYVTMNPTHSALPFGKVAQYDLNGNLIRSIDFRLPSGITYDAISGNVFVTSDTNNAQVYMYSPNLVPGSPSSYIIEEVLPGSGINGLAYNSKNNHLFVAIIADRSGAPIVNEYALTRTRPPLVQSYYNALQAVPTGLFLAYNNALYVSSNALYNSISYGFVISYDILSGYILSSHYIKDGQFNYVTGSTTIANV